MNRLMKLGSVLVALVLLVAACGSTGTTPSPAAPATTAAAATPTATTAATPSPTEAAPSPSESPIASTDVGSPSPSPSPTAPPGAVEGTLTIWADNVRAPILQDVGAAFTAATGAQVQVYQIGFGDIRDRLIQQGPANEGPDIIIGAHDWLGQLVDAGVVEELDLSSVADNFREVALNAFQYNGKQYGMPYVSEAIALYYNKDLVTGGVAPTTWDDLKAQAAAFQGDDPSKQGFCMQKGDPYHSYPILTGFGGYIFGKNDDGSYNPGDVGLDSPGGLAYAEELDSLVKDGLLRDNVDYGACTTLMTTGKAMFWMTGPWALNDFNTAHDTNGLNFGVAPIPMMANQPRPFVGVQGFMVNKFAVNKTEAEAFLTEYVATDDVMQQLWEADPRLPVWNKLADSMTDPNIIAFTESAKNGDPMPAIPEMSNVWGAWTDAINLVFTQQDEPDAAFQDAATKIRDLIGQ